MNITLRRTGRGSRVNRDRRSVTFERSVIAEATRRFNATQTPADIEVCPVCIGSKEVHHESTGPNLLVECPECNGKGWVS